MIATILRHTPSCLLCGRQPGESRMVGTKTVRVIRPEEAEAVRNLRCPSCSGRLYSSDVTTVVSTRMTPDEFRALGEAEQGKRRSNERQIVLCPDCKDVEIRPTSNRCRGCSKRHRDRLSLKWRLVAALETGLTFDMDDLCRKFGVTAYGLKHALTEARRDGKAIAVQGGRVCMGVGS